MQDTEDDHWQTGRRVVVFDKRLGMLLLAVVLNMAAIVCNFVTFFFLGKQLPDMPVFSMSVTNNISSCVGLATAALSLSMGWLYIRDLPNRLSFSLLCMLSAIVSLATMS